MTSRRRPQSSYDPPDIQISDPAMQVRLTQVERGAQRLEMETREIRSTMATTDDIRSIEKMIGDVATDTKNSITNIATDTKNSIAGLAKDISSIGRPQWQALSVGITVVVLIGTLVYWPIREKQSDSAERQATLEKVVTAGFQRVTDATAAMADQVANTYTTKREFDIRFASGNQRRDDMQRLIEERIKRNEIDIEQIGKQVVPRGEHAEKWEGQRSRDADFQRQLDSLKADYSALYSPRDAISNMQRRIEDLERRIIAATVRSQSGMPP